MPLNMTFTANLTTKTTDLKQDDRANQRSLLRHGGIP